MRTKLPTLHPGPTHTRRRAPISPCRTAAPPLVAPPIGPPRTEGMRVTPASWPYTPHSRVGWVAGRVGLPCDPLVVVIASSPQSARSRHASSEYSIARSPQSRHAVDWTLAAAHSATGRVAYPAITQMGVGV